VKEIKSLRRFEERAKMNIPTHPDPSQILLESYLSKGSSAEWRLPPENKTGETFPTLTSNKENPTPTVFQPNP
jgi:hypothetical protein